MKKLGKLAVPLAVALILQSTIPVSAAGGLTSEISAIPISAAADKATPAQVKITLEDAIKTVKSYFTVPANYNVFSSGYNNYNDRETWSLNWTTKDESGGSFNAQVDVTTGEIVYMNYWKPSSVASPSVPKYSYEEAKAIAEELVNKLLKDKLDQLRLQSQNEQIIPLIDYGHTSYTLQWKRVANGVLFPSNGVSVTVNADDGSIAGFSLTWTKANIPDLNGVISQTEAREIFAKNKLLELQYYINSGIRPVDSRSKDSAKSAQLVYKISNDSYNGYIDAKTGEPLKLNPGEWIYVDSLLDNVGGMGSASKEMSDQALTPEELKEIEDTAKLLTQEAAIANVKKWVEIPENIKLQSANLGLDGAANPKRVWSLNWSSEENDSYKYVYARVDASTGEVLSFNVYSSDQGSNDAKAIDRTAAKAIADDFLKRIQPNRAQQVEYVELQEYGQIYPMEQQTHYFSYQRLVNGVPVPGNGFSISVDSKTQKVTGYDMNFADVIFPAVSQAMSQKQGEDTFLTKRPLDLKYVQVYKNGQLSDIRLVYYPRVDNEYTVSNMMDAKTGEFLDWQGKPLKEQPRPYSFKDIAGNFAEEEIKLLGQAGAFGEYKDQFKPDENVNLESLLRAMIVAKNGAWSNSDLTDEELLKYVQEQGWLKESASLNDQVTREFMAKLVVRMEQLEKVAQMEGIFQVPYDDIANDSENLGYIALAKGLKIVNVEGNHFEPAKKVTRAEAAYAIVKALRANP